MSAWKIGCGIASGWVLFAGSVSGRGTDIVVETNDTSGWYSNYRVGETTASTKIIIDKTTNKILGAHLLGPGYAELINIFALAIKLGLTSKQLKSMTATYPSIGSDIGSML